MPPQGESTGVAIEDGVLLAHVFQRHASRSVAELFTDYEKLRRQRIEKLFKDTTWRWQNAASHDASWVWSIFIDWLTAAFVWFMKWRGEDYFADDVSKLALPA
jgi:2-polyprenyl-6-methoxyphenol hydroxylase-like FAD-dependent oxidoreductase